MKFKPGDYILWRHPDVWGSIPAVVEYTSGANAVHVRYPNGRYSVHATKNCRIITEDEYLRYAFMWLAGIPTEVDP